MKYTLVFARLTLKDLFVSVFYYINVVVMTILLMLIMPKLSPLFTVESLAELAAGKIVYTLLSTGMLLVLMCAWSVFLAEKDQGSILPLLSSPARAEEILLGKCLGLVIAATFGAGFSLFIPLISFPIILKAMVSLKIVAAFGIIFGILFGYALIVGMLLLCFTNARYVYVMLFFVNTILMSLQKHMKVYMDANGLGSANWAHLIPLVFLFIGCGIVYKFYFSKHRIVASI